MKSLRKYSLFGALTAAALAFTGSAEASITGQWDFKSGNLNATIGSPINVYDSQSNPSFGTTATFGISPINGSVTNVLGFPTATGDHHDTRWFEMRAGENRTPAPGRRPSAGGRK